MDKLIRRFDGVDDADLFLCLERGVAYQREMDFPINYDEDYIKHYRSLDGSEISDRLNKGRIDFVARHYDGPMIDIGIGSGEFIRKRGNCKGFDINPHALKWLLKENCYSEHIDRFDAISFWDVLEHVPNPNSYLKQVKYGAHLFTSVPIFDNLHKIRESKHYKPNEHLYYFTHHGFVNWMALYGFRLLECSDFETQAGRESIMSYAFVRDLPGYHDTVDQYKSLHANYYGASAHLYFQSIAQQVLALSPGSILDYGCGRSDLVAHFWKDGKRRIEKYDPAINDYKRMPEGEFDLVLCTDVMEHILMSDVDRVFDEIKSKSENVIFTISMKPARAKLPDGRNAHVTLLSPEEWLRWIESKFGKAIRKDTNWPHIMMVRTFTLGHGK